MMHQAPLPVLAATVPAPLASEDAHLGKKMLTWERREPSGVMIIFAQFVCAAARRNLALPDLFEPRRVLDVIMRKVSKRRCSCVKMMEEFVNTGSLVRIPWLPSCAHSMS